MADRRVFLKVKLKSLAEEARIIKREENRRKMHRRRWHPCWDVQNPADIPKQATDRARQVRDEDEVARAKRRAQPWYPMSAQELHELHRHRIDVVRVEARLTGIAYALIRGRLLGKIDSCAGLSEGHIQRIQSMIKRYGDTSEPVQKMFVETKPREVIDGLMATSRKQEA